tara:strand:+ start:1134 stop:1364 length:231 start_codon:yes stop_codon:yes gene_type:complete
MDIFITKQEFIEGVSWYWESGDTDTWFYDSINNIVKQNEGDLYAEVSKLETESFIYNYIGAELQSYPYEWLPKYDG